MTQYPSGWWVWGASEVLSGWVCIVWALPYQEPRCLSSVDWQSLPPVWLSGMAKPSLDRVQMLAVYTENIHCSSSPIPFSQRCLWPADCSLQFYLNPSLYSSVCKPLLPCSLYTNMLSFQGGVASPSENWPTDPRFSLHVPWSGQSLELCSKRLQPS